MHLPTLELEETLYSWCGTTHSRSGQASVRQTSQQLFGSDHAGRLHDFPSHLNTFHARTDGRFGEPRAIALSHSLLGYYLPFRPFEDGQRILNAVLAGSLPDIKMRLGIPASRFGGYHPLRYCSECVRTNIDQIGWSVWQVQHQWPSSLVCRSHARPLVQLWHPITPVHRRKWLRPMAGSGEGEEELRIGNDDALQSALTLADFSWHAAQLSPGAIDPRRMSDVLRQWARDRSCLTDTGSVRYKRLLALIERASGWLVEALAGVPHVGYRADLTNIIAAALSRSPTPVHPLKHLLLATAMFDTWDVFWAAYSCGTALVTSTRAPRPAPSSRYLVPNQRNEFLRILRAGRSVRTASSTVGVSTGTGLKWAHQAGIPVASRPKKLNAAVLASIRGRLEQGIDRSTVAAEFDISVTSIHRLMSTDHVLRDAWASIRHDVARDANRYKVQETLVRSPSISAGELRRAVPGAWAWLYRNDRNWLVEHLPSLWRSIGGRRPPAGDNSRREN